MNLHKAFMIIAGDIGAGRVFTKMFKNRIVINGSREGEVLTFAHVSTMESNGEVTFLSSTNGTRRYYWKPHERDHLMNSPVLEVYAKPLVKGGIINIKIDYSMAGRTRP